MAGVDIADGNLPRNHLSLLLECDNGMTCDGNEISLTVNGDMIKRVTDSKYNLGGGLVGFYISSLNVLPITVEVDWFQISEP